MSLQKSHYSQLEEVLLSLRQYYISLACLSNLRQWDFSANFGFPGSWHVVGTPPRIESMVLG
jgi:hypothetical protein